MASTIQVTSATVTTKKNNLKTLNAKFKSQLSDMDTTEKQLITMWDGDAATAFNKSYATDTLKMEALYNAVNEYCTALEKIVKQYETSEKKNVSIAKKRG